MKNKLQKSLPGYGLCAICRGSEHLGGCRLAKNDGCMSGEPMAMSTGHHVSKLGKCAMCKNMEHLGKCGEMKVLGKSEDSKHLQSESCNECGKAITYHSGSRRWNHADAMATTEKDHRDGRYKPKGWSDPWHRASGDKMGKTERDPCPHCGEDRNHPSANGKHTSTAHHNGNVRCSSGGGSTGWKPGKMATDTKKADTLLDPAHASDPDKREKVIGKAGILPSDKKTKDIVEPGSGGMKKTTAPMGASPPKIKLPSVRPPKPKKMSMKSPAAGTSSYSSTSVTSAPAPTV